MSDCAERDTYGELIIFRKMTYGRYFFIGLLLGAVAPFAASSAVLKDDFAGDAIAPEFWSVEQTGQVALTVGEGALRIITPGKEEGKARLTLNGKAHGDFDVQVAYKVPSDSGEPDARFHLYVGGPTGYATVYYHRFEGNQDEIIFGGTLDGSADVYADRLNVPDEGHLRIQRKGMSFTAYYWDGLTWQNLGSQNGFPDDASPRIQVHTTKQFPSAEFSVTDFHLEAEGLVSNLKFATQPANARRYTAEGPYSLRAAAERGLGPISYQWTFDNGSGPAPVGRESTYAIAAPSPAHSGTYVCEATDAAGTLKSSPAKVEFADRMAFSSQPAETKRYVDEGSFAFTAGVTGGFVPLTYKWFVDKGSGAIQLATTAATYNFDPVTLETTGTYWCEVSDAREVVKSNPVSVTIAERLHFTAQPAGVSRYVDEGPYALSVAVAGGLGPIAYKWFLETGSGATQLAAADATYTLDPPKTTDSGQYWCVVNDARETVKSAPAAVAFAERMTFTKQPAETTRFTDEGPFTLSAAVSGGIGTPVFKWLFDNGSGAVEIAAAAASYTIEHPTPAHSGSYCCEVSDGRETIKSTPAPISFSERPAAPPPPEPPNPTATP